MPAEADVDTREAFGAALEHPFDENLICAMQWLRRRPGDLVAQGAIKGLAATLALEARQFPAACIAGHVNDVLGVIHRQADVADLVGDAQPPKMLHGARSR